MYVQYLNLFTFIKLQFLTTIQLVQEQMYIYESSIHKVRDLLFQPWLGSLSDSDTSNYNKKNLLHRFKIMSPQF